eukprot:366162-Chlamydomonas_euryale.AAC.11
MARRRALIFLNQRPASPAWWDWSYILRAVTSLCAASASPRFRLGVAVGTFSSRCAWRSPSGPPLPVCY